MNENLSESRISRDFFMTDAVNLALKLIGKKIVRKIRDKLIICRIVETEAYMAPQDKASHAYLNKKTERNKYLWKLGGNLYICNIYGNTFCLSILANDETKPETVLIRAVEPEKGLASIIENRKNIIKINQKNLSFLTNGPGKTTEALMIDKTFNGIDLTTSSFIYLLNDLNSNFEIGISERINIKNAKDFKNKLWRFYIKNNKFVSKVKFK